MPTYNFTIRASDESGAYADRDFSINVRNTIVDRYVIGTDNASNIVTSTNGNTWTTRPVVFPQGFASSTTVHSGILYNNATWLAWYSSTSANGTKFLYSNDAVNWTNLTEVEIDGYPVALSSFDAGYFQMSVIDGKFCFVGKYYQNDILRTRLLRSSDGINWTTPQGYESTESLDIPSLSDAKLTKIGNDYYYNNKILKDDATTVVAMTTPTTFNIRFGVHYYNGLYIAATNSSLYTSVDGSTWVSRALPNLGSNPRPCDIIYGNGRLIVVADAVSSTAMDFVYTSTNGITWTKTTLNSSFGTYGNTRMIIKYSNGKFILGCTTSKNLKVSYDGINWTNISPSLPYNVCSIAAMDL